MIVCEIIIHICNIDGQVLHILLSVTTLVDSTFVVTKNLKMTTSGVWDEVTGERSSFQGKNNLNDIEGNITYPFIKTVATWLDIGTT